MKEYSVRYIQHSMRGNTYFVPGYATHRPAARAILGDQFYEPETHIFVKNLFEGKKGSMIHAGTFFGDMLPSFSSSVDGIVYAFEPVLENYILARLCVEENSLGNVVLYNSALSDKAGNLRINTGLHKKRHRGGASFIDDRGSICSTLKIDDLSYENLLLIQLDVEGYELFALKGAQLTIQKHRPWIAVEDINKNCSSLFKEIGYHFLKAIPGLKIWIPSEISEPDGLLVQ